MERDQIKQGIQSADDDYQVDDTARLLDESSPTPSEHGDKTSQFVVRNSTKHRHGLFLTIINLVNDVISVGVISSPYYFMQGGVWVTLAALSVYLCLNAYTLQLVHRLVAIHNYHNFTEMCYGALGLPGFLAGSAAVVLLNWGSQVAQLLIIGTAGPKVLQRYSDFVLFERRYLIIAVVVIAFPIAMFKSVARLGIPSLLNQIFLIAALIIILIKTMLSVQDGIVNHDPLDRTSVLGTLATVGGLSYFYVCQDMSVQVMHALHHSTQRRWAVVAWIVPSSLMVMCVLLGLLGALFVSGNDDLLNALPEDDTAVIAARCLVALAILCAVPYNIFLPRVALTAVLKGFFPRWTIRNAEDPWNRTRRNIVHVALTILLLSSAVIVAELVTSLGMFFEIIGAVSGVGIGLVLPPLCHIRLSQQHWTHRENRVPMLVCCFGLCSMIGCLSSLIISGGSSS